RSDLSDLRGEGGSREFFGGRPATLRPVRSSADGALDRGTRTARPAGFGDLPPPPSEHRGGSVAGVWLGVLAGGIIGLGAVCGLGFLGPAIPHPVRGAL